ncbi:hypothetical protein VPJ68_11125, partial [Parabacteroides distasonis]
CLESALNISIKAAKGESIEDADDWRKKLKLKYRNEINKPEVTEEIAKKVQEDFSDLLRLIDNKQITEQDKNNIINIISKYIQ